MKKFANYLIAFFTLVSFQACGSTGKPQHQENAEEKILIGHYIYGHEVNSFRPCNHKDVFWVLGSNEILDLMAKKYSNQAINPYDEIYIKIIGDYLNKAYDGFAMDYDGQVQVKKIFFMKKKSDINCK